MINRGAGWFPLDVGYYPDGLPTVNFWDSTIFPMSVCLRPLSLDSFMTGLFFVDALKERGQKDIVLVLPCIPGARQDRLNNKGDYLFTLKSVAREINLRGFKRVETFDTHSDVSHIIDSLYVTTPKDILTRYWSLGGFPYCGVIAPDSGSSKRAGDVADRYNVPLIQGWKKREVGTGKLSGFGIDKATLDRVADDYVYPKFLIVDDLCDAGGTFMGLAAEFDYPVDLYVTHGLFTKGTSTLLTRFGEIFTTNSTLAAETADGVKVINIL